MKATVVEQDFAVAPQVTAADIADLAKEGVKTLINNRPDGEEPVQLSSADARAQAEKLGLQYIYLPVRTDTITFAGAVNGLPGYSSTSCLSVANARFQSAAGARKT